MQVVSYQLLLHAVIVLLIGLLAGIPYGRAINNNASERLVAAWRLAHQALPIGATLTMVIAMMLPALAVSNTLKWVIAGALIASNYAFVVALNLAPVVGYRGLTSAGPMKAKVVYWGNALGAMTSLVATVVLLYAVWVSF